MKKQPYMKPAMQVIDLPEEELFTTSLFALHLFGGDPAGNDDDLDFEDGGTWDWGF